MNDYKFSEELVKALREDKMLVVESEYHSVKESNSKYVTKVDEVTRVYFKPITPKAIIKVG